MTLVWIAISYVILSIAVWFSVETSSPLAAVFTAIVLLVALNSLL